MRPLSVSTALFGGYPIEIGFAEIAAAGVGHVEPAFIKGYIDFDEDVFAPAPAAAIGSALRAAGLSCFAVSAHYDLGAPDATAAVTRRLRFAGLLGARILITNATAAGNLDAF